MTPNDRSAQRPTYPQSWNLYSYVLNNPLSSVDLTGHDCVYFNAQGNGIDEIDPDTQDQSLNAQASGCSSGGGAYINGTVDPKSVKYDSDSDTFQIKSVDSLFKYSSLVTASGPNAFFGSNITDGVLSQTPTLLPSSIKGDFSLNESASELQTQLHAAGVNPSPVNNKYNPFHSGSQFRGDSPGCSLHVIMDSGSSTNGRPATGDYHYDLINPIDNPVSTVLHGGVALAPDMLQKALFRPFLWK